MEAVLQKEVELLRKWQIELGKLSAKLTAVELNKAAADAQRIADEIGRRKYEISEMSSDSIPIYSSSER